MNNEDIRRVVGFLANQEEWLRFLGLVKTADTLHGVARRYEKAMLASNATVTRLSPANHEDHPGVTAQAKVLRVA